MAEFYTGTIEEEVGFGEVGEKGEPEFYTGGGEGEGERRERSRLPELKGSELILAKTSPRAYAALRTAIDFTPLLSYARYAFPSAREEFMQKSTAAQHAELALHALAVIPVPYIGKGIKLLAKGLSFAIKKGAKVAKQKALSIPYTDDLMEKFSFERLSAGEKLVRKYKISGEEAEAIRGGSNIVWEKTGRGWMPGKTSKEFGKLFKKDGTLQDAVAKNLKEWNKPFEEQWLEELKKYWQKRVERVLRVELKRGKYGKERLERVKIDDLFEDQAKRVYNRSELPFKVTLKNADQTQMEHMVRDLMVQEGKTFGKLDITNSVFANITPVRKVAGKFDKHWGTYTLYKRIKKAIGDSNTYQYMLANDLRFLMAHHGLGAITKKATGEYILKGGPSGLVYREAGKVLRKMDNMRGKGASTEEVKKFLEMSTDKETRKLVYAVEDWLDRAYQDYAISNVWRTFEAAGLNAEGKAGLTALMNGAPKTMEGGVRGALAGAFTTSPVPGLKKVVGQTFSSRMNLAHEGKKEILEKVLAKLRQEVDANPNWFSEMDDATKKLLLKRLTLGKGKENFLDYSANYAPRIGTTPKYPKVGDAPATGAKKASFEKRRVLEENVEATDELGVMVTSRLRAQGKALHLYPAIEELTPQINQLPYRLNRYFNHYIARAQGMPSEADKQVAKMISRTPFLKQVDAGWIGRVAWGLNDLVYMGGIGFKPFSAMRNYFQPFLLVPADMGGIKDFRWLVHGYGRALRAADRDYLISIGAITDYSPDIFFRPNIFKHGKTRELFGSEFNLPDAQRVRNVAMFLFKASDRHNRYVTGSAALAKWEHHFRKHTKFRTIDGVGFKAFDRRGLEAFKKEVNLSSRDPWVRSEISKLLEMNSDTAIEEAKKIWTLNVIADTQYLYGIADSPIFNQAGGIIAKTGGVFQSWWMNYTSAVWRWMTGASAGRLPVTDRMIAAGLSSAISGTIMAQLWGAPTAARTVGLGPFPTGLDVPAPWKPFKEATMVIYEASQGVFSAQTEEGMERSLRRARAIIKSIAIYIPGGLQGYTFYRGAQKEGLEGLAKGVFKFKF